MRALIPAGGLGTRWYPWSRIIPKELLPIGNYPALHYVLDEAVAAGIKEIGIIINRNKPLIRAYVKNIWSNNHSEIRLRWFYQQEALGVGDALLCAEKWVDNEPTAILYPDEVHPVGGGISLICKAFQRSPGCWIGLTSGKQKRRQMRVAIMKTGNNIYGVSAISPRGHAQKIGYATGRYVFAEGLRHVQKTVLSQKKPAKGELDDDQIFAPLNTDISAIVLPGPIYDVGSPDNWRLAVKRNLKESKGN